MHEEDALAGLGAIATVAEAAMQDGQITDRELKVLGGIGLLWLGAKAMREESGHHQA